MVMIPTFILDFRHRASRASTLPFPCSRGPESSLPFQRGHQQTAADLVINLDLEELDEVATLLVGAKLRWIGVQHRGLAGELVLEHRVEVGVKTEHLVARRALSPVRLVDQVDQDIYNVRGQRFSNLGVRGEDSEAP